MPTDNVGKECEEMGIQSTAFAIVASDPECKEYKPDRHMWKARLKVPKEITKNGETYTVHDWLNAVAFGNVVETLRQAVQNDGFIFTGEIRLEKWQGRDGNERSSLSFNVKSAYKVVDANAPTSDSDSQRDVPDEDIPF